MVKWLETFFWNGEYVSAYIVHLQLHVKFSTVHETDESTIENKATSFKKVFCIHQFLLISISVEKSGIDVLQSKSAKFCFTEYEDSCLER